jgi:DNA polymerase III alpha subunit
LEDEAGGTKCVLWPETFRKFSALIRNDHPVLMTGRLELAEDNPPSIIVDQVQSLEDVARSKELVVLRVPHADDPSELFDSILHLINTHAGSCELMLETVVDVDLLVRLKVNSTLRVERSEKLETEFRKVGCTPRFEKIAMAASAGKPI